jgi:hypothetical protein
LEAVVMADVRWRVLCIDEFNSDSYWTPPSSPPTMAEHGWLARNGGRRDEEMQTERERERGEGE